MADNMKVSVGMPLSDIMGCLSNPKLKANNSAKKLLNFIQHDDDKIVTNDVERHLLQSWLNGEEKVKMPEKMIGWKRVNGKIVSVKRRVKSLEASGSHYKKWSLKDTNGDGYADTYQYANAQRYYADKNLDGKFDTGSFFVYD